MKINIHTVVLKSIPYLMSIAGGIILYTGAIDNAPNDNIRDLVINVSASLLSIPLVFLLYDYTNSRVNRQMRRSLANSVSDRLNTVMLTVIMLLRTSMGIRSRLTTENVNRMLIMRSTEIARRLRITPQVIQQLQICHNDLDTLLYRSGQNEVLASEQTQILTSLARDIMHLMNESKFHYNRHLASKHVESIMGHILDWLDSDSVAALKLQHHLSTGTNN